MANDAPQDPTSSTVATAKDAVELRFFPDEGNALDGGGTGHVYVMQASALLFKAAARGGPRVEHGNPDGHTAGQTSPGDYVLGSREHHVTSAWPYSTIPQGALLKEKDGQVLWSPDDGVTWRPASGRDSVTWASWADWKSKILGRALTPDDKASVDRDVRRAFNDESGGLLPRWLKNDFGLWAWRLWTADAAGNRLAPTAFFVHTTPENERATDDGKPVSLSESHGCIHLRPADRALLMTRGWLRAGASFRVFRYGMVGPGTIDPFA